MTRRNEYALGYLFQESMQRSASMTVHLRLVVESSKNIRNTIRDMAVLMLQSTVFQQ